MKNFWCTVILRAPKLSIIVCFSDNRRPCLADRFDGQEREVVSSGQVSLVANEVPGPFRKKSIVKMVLSP